MFFDEAFLDYESGRGADFLDRESYLSGQVFVVADLEDCFADEPFCDLPF
jgi:hypothetical protein